MKNIGKIFNASALPVTLLGPMSSFAQDRHDDHAADHHDDHHDAPKYVRHDEWKKGARLKQEDWARDERIDYHRYHLSAPPHGYEWRQIDGNDVLAAVATGVVASVIVASSVH